MGLRQAFTTEYRKLPINESRKIPLASSARFLPPPIHSKFYVSRSKTNFLFFRFLFYFVQRIRRNEKKKRRFRVKSSGWRINDFSRIIILFIYFYFLCRDMKEKVSKNSGPTTEQDDVTSAQKKFSRAAYENCKYTVDYKKRVCYFCNAMYFCRFETPSRTIGRVEFIFFAGLSFLDIFYSKWTRLFFELKKFLS